MHDDVNHGPVSYMLSNTSCTSNNDLCESWFTASAGTVIYRYISLYVHTRHLVARYTPGPRLYQLTTDGANRHTGLS